MDSDGSEQFEPLSMIGVDDGLGGALGGGAYAFIDSGRYSTLAEDLDLSWPRDIEQGTPVRL